MTYALSSHTDTDRIDLEDCQLNISQQNHKSLKEKTN